MCSSVLSKQFLISFTLFFLFCSCPTLARRPHIISIRSPNLFPEGLEWDPSAQHFIVGSVHQRSIHAVSDAGVIETLIFDPLLPENVTILGLAVDTVNNRLLAAVHALEPLPPFDALAAYDLRTRHRLFLAPLNDGDSSERQLANDVAIDFKGNAYVTNSASNFIWKVNLEGETSVLSRSSAFTSHPVDPNSLYSFYGLNGITYVTNGYLLVIQSNTGKMFKVDTDDGKARLVLLNKDLPLADGIAIRRDGVVVVVSQHKAWFLKSQDSWGEAVVYDEVALDVERSPTSVAIREGERAYVIYGHALEGLAGNVEREWFTIEEVESSKDSGEESVWVFVLIGLGLAYFMFWRFQMGQLVRNMNKKTA